MFTEYVSFYFSWNSWFFSIEFSITDVYFCVPFSSIDKLQHCSNHFELVWKPCFIVFTWYFNLELEFITHFFPQIRSCIYRFHFHNFLRISWGKSQIYTLKKNIYCEILRKNSSNSHKVRGRITISKVCLIKNEEVGKIWAI